jgi:Uma2 family endonuclease
LLVIEVADTTLAYDRDVKGPLYARAGIPEFWLVDLGAGAITVYRGPHEDGYRDVVTAARGEALRPLLLPDITIAADDILG